LLLWTTKDAENLLIILYFPKTLRRDQDQNIRDLENFIPIYAGYYYQYLI